MHPGKSRYFLSASAPQGLFISGTMSFFCPVLAQQFNDFLISFVFG
jgi:hypothetical protein